MKAGRLRHRISVQSVTRTADTTGGGGYSETWSTVPHGETWASVDPVSGSYAERVAGAKVAEVVTHIVRLRHLPNVTTDCRVLFGDRVFDVRGVSNIGERDRELLLACEER